MDKLHDSLEELVEGEDGAEGGWEVEYSVSSQSLLLLFVPGRWSTNGRTEVGMTKELR